jgi:IclR helix-turn-helix domain
VAGLTDVAQTIEQRLREIEAQLRAHDELAGERDRLQRALHELRSDDGARPGRASRKPSTSRQASAGRRGGASRARRGANIEAITSFVTANPGATAAEIATGTGIGRGVVYSATSRLAGSGRLRRVARDDRQVGYQRGGDDTGRAAAGEPAEAAVPALEAVGSRATRELRAAKRPATGARAPAAGRKGAKRVGRAASGRRGGATGGRAPRGANREAVLGAIGERPGVSVRELAAASGVTGGTLYALLRTLTQRGEIDKQQLPSGHTGYTLATTPPAATPSAPPTPPDNPTDSAAALAPAAGREEHDTTTSPTAGDDVPAAQAPSGEKPPHAAADSQ